MSNKCLLATGDPILCVSVVVDGTGTASVLTAKKENARNTGFMVKLNVECFSMAKLAKANLQATEQVGRNGKAN